MNFLSSYLSLKLLIFSFKSEWDARWIGYSWWVVPFPEFLCSISILFWLILIGQTCCEPYGLSLYASSLLILQLSIFCPYLRIFIILRTFYRVYQSIWVYVHWTSCLLGLGAYNPQYWGEFLCIISLVIVCWITFHVLQRLQWFLYFAS